MKHKEQGQSEYTSSTKTLNPTRFSSSTTHKSERFDYTNQAWIGADGRYLSCAHPAAMFCRCYGKLHAGELADFTDACSIHADHSSPETAAKCEELRAAAESNTWTHSTEYKGRGIMQGEFLVALATNFDQAALIISEHNAQPVLLAALASILEQAKSWHTMHGHTRDSVQCDSICELIPTMEAAIQKARRG
jgi:hypothetical protein